jgi:hypothetical protein
MKNRAKTGCFGSVENPTGGWLIFAKSAEPRRAGVPVPVSEVVSRQCWVLDF